MKSFKCMECGKIYLETDHPIVKDTKMDGCCSVGSLIEIKSVYTVKELIETLSQFNPDAVVSFTVDFDNPKTTNAFGLSMVLSGPSKDSIEEIKARTLKIDFGIGNKFLLALNRSIGDDELRMKIDSINEYDDQPKRTKKTYVTRKHNQVITEIE